MDRDLYCLSNTCEPLPTAWILLKRRTSEEMMVEKVMGNAGQRTSWRTKLRGGLHTRVDEGRKQV